MHHGTSDSLHSQQQVHHILRLVVLVVELVVEVLVVVMVLMV
jgi:hypothetical protein